MTPTSFKKNTAALALLALSWPLIALAGTAPPPTIPAARPDPKAVLDFSRSLLRVNSTSQFFDFRRPWTKKPPFSRRGTGVVIGPNEVLVSASLVVSATYIDFERPNSSERTPAQIKHIDYDANLALLEASDPTFLQNNIPLALDESARIGSFAEILQLEPNGDIAPTTARITTITTAPYVFDDAFSLLIFRLTAPIQQRDHSFVLPAVKDGRLLGIVFRYDERNQTADVIPPPIIRRFLQDAKDRSLLAFPRAGISIAPLRNPQLRKYLNFNNNQGVLISSTDPRSPAASAGVQPNDILLAINGTPIDNDGSFLHPEFGRISLSYLITTNHRSGETARFSLLRNGQPLEIHVPLRRLLPEDQSVPRYWFDRQPYFLIAGGFLFQELTRTHLLEFGNDWRDQAPARLVAADILQNTLRPNGEKVVFLSAVIPLPGTIGYEQLPPTIVLSVDDHPIHSLSDLQRALTTSVPKIFKIRISDDPRLLFLNSTSIEQAKPLLARHYGITQFSNLPPQPPPSEKTQPAPDSTTPTEPTTPPASPEPSPSPPPLEPTTSPTPTT